MSETGMSRKQHCTALLHMHVQEDRAGMTASEAPVMKKDKTESGISAEKGYFL